MVYWEDNSFLFFLPLFVLFCFLPGSQGMEGGVPGSEKWSLNNSHKFPDIVSFKYCFSCVSCIVSPCDAWVLLAVRWEGWSFISLTLLSCLLFRFCAICWMISSDPTSSPLISLSLFIICCLMHLGFLFQLSSYFLKVLLWIILVFLIPWEYFQAFIF